MGQKVKGGLWCDACARPVAGIKTRHRMRNLASNMFSGPAAGLLLGTSKYRDWGVVGQFDSGGRGNR